MPRGRIAHRISQSLAQRPAQRIASRVASRIAQILACRLACRIASRDFCGDMPNRERGDARCKILVGAHGLPLAGICF
ncbi:uncharacterized protein THITE_2086744 [Thermothielavioides terrestris NRRL 8126]|uniref:Uncharacterized protein n=1 Tax=Thermothielavioides terrestris (strain ATCC 38088 / NRRL 8126) TaxID=578455 RepID=G2R4M3_THETT|nr:uncharacterized protein THITE_2086744 [Thermothielavioides terrestris NRRL 8126]AEO65258.1 hypothetical protein THITE_2086744 [Thermothielavioides terrestris NRRL 8126]